MDRGTWQLQSVGLQSRTRLKRLSIHALVQRKINQLQLQMLLKDTIYSYSTLQIVCINMTSHNP